MLHENVLPSIRCIGVHQGFCGTKIFCCVWITICTYVNPSPKKPHIYPVILRKNRQKYQYICLKYMVFKELCLNMYHYIITEGYTMGNLDIFHVLCKKYKSVNFIDCYSLFQDASVQTLLRTYLIPSLYNYFTYLNMTWSLIQI